jgi:hypothetical protein
MRLLKEQVAWMSIGQVRACEGHTTGVYGAGFRARSLARKGARDGMRGTRTRLVLTRNWWRLGGWRKVTTEGDLGRRMRVEGSDKRI